MKKADFHLDMNWWFAGIVGTLLIFSVTSFIVRQDKVATVTTNRNVIDSIDLFFSIQNDQVNFDEIKLPSKTEIEFDSASNTFSIDTQSRRVPDDRIIFSRTYDTDRMFVQGKDLRFPYSIGNIIYVTSDTIFYYIVGEGPLAKKINTSMHPRIPRKLVDSTADITPQPYIGHKIVIVSDDETMFSFDFDPEVMQIFPGQKKIRFYAHGSYAESTYPDFDTLLGSLFVKDLASYEANMRKIKDNLHVTAPLYIETVKKLQQEYPACIDLYNASEQKLHVLNGSDSMGELMGAKELLDDYNDMIKERGCIEIY